MSVQTVCSGEVKVTYLRLEGQNILVLEVLVGGAADQIPCDFDGGMTPHLREYVSAT